MTYASDRTMRASDGDRAKVQSQLNDAFADGRLSRDEWDERASDLDSSMTYGDLDRLTGDLVVPPPEALPRSNSLAVASLVCGIAQIFFWFPASVAAVILGHRARRQIRRSGERGAGLAQAGLILGYAGLLMTVLALLLLLAFVVAVIHSN